MIYQSILGQKTQSSDHYPPDPSKILALTNMDWRAMVVGTATLQILPLLGPYSNTIPGPVFGGQAVRQLPCGNSRYVLFVRGASLINLPLLKQERIYGIVHWKLKDELFDRQILTTLTEARVLIKECAKEHNQVRPHTALSYRAPVPEVIMRLDSNLESGIINGGRSLVFSSKRE